MSAIARVLLGLTLVPLSGCIAKIGGATESGGDQAPTDATSTPVVCSPASTQVLAPARVRRLTEAEYSATLAAISSATDLPIVKFPKDPVSDGYINRADNLRMSSILAQNLWNAAPDLADRVALSLLAAAPCDPNADSEGCAQQILTAAATLAYRRPVAGDELTDLMSAFRVGADGEDFATGLTTALRVVVQSAGLLYHTEIGDGASGAPVRLTPYEVAEELAYLTTGGPPDATLMQAAESGGLDSAAARAEQMQRLLLLPAAQTALGGFASQWLEASGVALPAAGDADSAIRDAALYPDWPLLRDHALGETQAFFARAVLEDNASLGALLTANWTAADETMVAFYGASAADATGRVTLPQGQRVGVLTQAAVLAARAHLADDAPVQRGHFVSSRLLCNTIGAAPASLNVKVPTPDPSRTTREIYAEHSSNAACLDCHSKMDPIGFGFENYDAIGRYRSTDNGKPVDASGTLVGSDVDGPFNGPVELAELLAQSGQARECFARQWFEYSMAAGLDEQGVCGVRAAASDFIAGNASVRELMLAFVRSDMFVTRVGDP